MARYTIEVKKLLLPLAFALALLPQLALAGSQTFTYTGSSQTFTVPAGVNAIKAFLIGGGGGGGGGNNGWGSGAGGGCGGSVNGTQLSVTPGQTIPVTVGAGGAGGGTAGNGGWGGTSSFGSTSAAGGAYGHTGYYNFSWYGYHSYGGGSGGGGGGNGWGGYQMLNTSGGTAGSNDPYNAQIVYYDEDGNSYVGNYQTSGFCVGDGWAVNPGTYITKSSWTSGLGGQDPHSYAYWGGGGGGGVIINSSTVKGEDGHDGYQVPSWGYPGPGGAGYGAGGGGSGLDYYVSGGSGAPGAVYVEWTASCTFNGQNVANGSGVTAYQSSTVAYGSSCASQTRTCNDGTLSGSYQYNACSVTAPPPIAHLTAPVTAYVGQAFAVSSTFTAGGSDTLLEDNIDSPLGTGLGANTFASSPKSISYSTSSPGVVTFYARARSSSYPSWALYDTKSVTVLLPAAPTATLTVNSGTHYAGTPLTITATFATSTGDLLLEDNVDSPLGTGLGANTNPSLTKIISFTPSAAGTYTFYARARSSARPAWATYQTLDVTVLSPCAPHNYCVGNNVYNGDTVHPGCANTLQNSCSYLCSNGGCVPPPAPLGTLADGKLIKAVPSLIHSGDSSHLTWGVNYVNPVSCSVTGTNGDSWQGAAGGTSFSGSVDSGSIDDETTFTLLCTGLDGLSVGGTATVSIAPIFQEF